MGDKILNVPERVYLDTEINGGEYTSYVFLSGVESLEVVGNDFIVNGTVHINTGDPVVTITDINEKVLWEQPNTSL